MNISVTFALVASLHPCVSAPLPRALSPRSVMQEASNTRYSAAAACVILGSAAPEQKPPLCDFPCASEAELLLVGHHELTAFLL